jgi:hypothetical protein
MNGAFEAENAVPSQATAHCFRWIKQKKEAAPEGTASVN